MLNTPPGKITRIQGQVGRWFGLAVFAGMTVHNALSMPSLDAPTVSLVRWALLTGLFLLFTLSYLRRPPDGFLASRPVEIILPFVVIALPTMQANGPFALARLAQDSEPYTSVLNFLLQPLGPGMGDIASLTGMALGEAFAIYAMLYLGRSFSVFAEARILVTGGPYRFVRHPLYFGEMVALWCYGLNYPSVWSLGMMSLFTVLQCWRARVEERKLLEHYPEYAKVLEQAGFLWPRWRLRT